jgi:hypothetical protein
MAAQKRKTVSAYVAERRARDMDFAEEFDKLQLARQMRELREKSGLSQASSPRAWARRLPASHELRAAALRRGLTCCTESRQRWESASGFSSTRRERAGQVKGDDASTPLRSSRQRCVLAFLRQLEVLLAEVAESAAPSIGPFTQDSGSAWRAVVPSPNVRRRSHPRKREANPWISATSGSIERLRRHNSPPKRSPVSFGFHRTAHQASLRCVGGESPLFVGSPRRRNPDLRTNEQQGCLAGTIVIDVENCGRGETWRGRQGEFL